MAVLGPRSEDEGLLCCNFRAGGADTGGVIVLGPGVEDAGNLMSQF